MAHELSILNEELQLLQEVWIYSFENHDGDVEEVFRNPSKNEWQKLPTWKKWKEVKFTIDPHKKVIYAWGADSPSDHDVVQQELGLGSDMLHMYYRKGMVMYNEIEGYGKRLTKEQMMQELKELTPLIKKVFGNFKFSGNIWKDL